MNEETLSAYTATALQEGLSWGDMLALWVQKNGVHNDVVEGEEVEVVSVPSPEKIRHWYECNVGKIIQQKTNIKPKVRIEYHGVNVSAKRLAEASGYSINTIYAYWQSSGKDTDIFSRKIDKRLDPQKRSKLLNTNEEVEGYFAGDLKEEDIIC